MSQHHKKHQDAGDGIENKTTSKESQPISVIKPQSDLFPNVRSNKGINRCLLNISTPQPHGVKHQQSQTLHERHRTISGGRETLVISKSMVLCSLTYKTLIDLFECYDEARQHDR